MLNEEAAQRLSKFMMVPNRVLAADVTLVLGMTLWERPLALARQVHEAGLAGTLIFTGGFNPKIHTTEADAMMDCWEHWGCPTGPVLLDNQASNTRENMLFSKSLLEECGKFKPDLKINVISINYHMCRALLTLVDVMGSHIRVGAVNYISQYCDPKSWCMNPRGQALVLQEARKIKTYFPHLVTPCHELA